MYVYKYGLINRQSQRSENTYAATLAARSFRFFMAIAARFELELIQYDTVNAFVHAQLDERVFMKLPETRNDFEAE